jgi:hypothetical protein
VKAEGKFWCFSRDCTALEVQATAEKLATLADYCTLVSNIHLNFQRT